MSTDPVVVLGTVAAMVGLGFLGYLLFERTRFTDVLILIAFGVLVGPVLGVFEPASMAAAATVVGALALVIIMFDGGLSLHISDLVRGIARSGLLAVGGFALTVVGVALASHYVLGLPWMPAFLLGTIVGGTSGVIIMPIIRRTSASDDARVLLSVESALTDVLCVIGTVTLLAVATGSSDVDVGDSVASALRSVTAQFAVAALFGFAAGILWLRILRIMRGKSNGYMLTLASILGLFSFTEAMGGNGAVSVLIFGVVLGNGFVVSHRLRMSGAELSDQQRQLQGEVTFLVRAFFFVYLGTLLDPALLVSPPFLLAALLLLAVCLAARAIAVHFATRGDAALRADRGLVTFLFPRGLAAAVLAGLPAKAGVPGTEHFVAYAFIVIVGSNLVGTGTVVAYEVAKRRRTGHGAPPSDAGVEMPFPGGVPTWTAAEAATTTPVSDAAPPASAPPEPPRGG